MKLQPAAVLPVISFALADDLHHFAAEGVDVVEVGAHAFQHDLAIDVDHVRVAHAPPVDDARHLHARLQFVGLHPHGEDAHVAGLHVFRDLAGQAGQRARRQIFQHEGLEGTADL